MKKLLLPGVFLSVGIVLTACQSNKTEVANEDPEITAVYSQGDISGADAKFVDKAIVLAMAIGKASDFARNKASRPEIRSFAQQLMDDYSRTNDSLVRIAQKRNLTVPTGLTEEETKQVKALLEMKGASLDKAYLALMIKNLKRSLEASRTVVDKTTEPELQAWTRSKAMNLEKQLQKADALLGDL